MGILGLHQALKVYFHLEMSMSKNYLMNLILPSH